MALNPRNEGGAPPPGSFEEGELQAARLCDQPTEALRPPLDQARDERTWLTTRLFRRSRRRSLDGFIGRLEDELRQRAQRGDDLARAIIEPDRGRGSKAPLDPVTRFVVSVESRPGGPPSGARTGSESPPRLPDSFFAETERRRPRRGQPRRPSEGSDAGSALPGAFQIGASPPEPRRREPSSTRPGPAPGPDFPDALRQPATDTSAAPRAVPSQPPTGGPALLPFQGTTDRSRKPRGLAATLKRAWRIVRALLNSRPTIYRRDVWDQ